MNYFSDKELGKAPCSKDRISVPAWNGLYAIIQKFLANNSLARNFPQQCPDGAGICGCDEQLLNASIKSVIPSFQIIPLKEITGWDKDEFPYVSSPEEDIQNTYAILDLIEFIYRNLNDSVETNFHAYFNHYHLKFKDTTNSKDEYRNQVNELFERNGIAYELKEDGCINRILPKPMVTIIRQAASVTTTDERLKELIDEAIKEILSPKEEYHIKALERIWDAFERLKTYYNESKKKSIEEIIINLSHRNTQFQEQLDKECKELTQIGNTFQIRHFEQHTVQITEQTHQDYLFFRMFAFIHLFLSETK